MEQTDHDYVETEEERKQRLSRPVRLPRITAPPTKTQEHVSTEIWGTSFYQQPPIFPVFPGGKKPRHQKGGYAEQPPTVVPPAAEEQEHKAPEDKPKKIEWMSASLVSVAFAVAALIAVIVVVKYTARE